MHAMAIGAANTAVAVSAPPPGPDKCFFCMGNNPDLPEHMAVVFGEDCYLATAKGPLPSPETFKHRGLNFPGHMIITTLQHTPTLSKNAEGMDEEQVDKTFKEMGRLRDSMQGMVSKLSKGKLGAVTWEISRGRNIHLHWQFMPVPADLVKSGTVEAGFRVLAKDLELGTIREKESWLLRTRSTVTIYECGYGPRTERVRKAKLLGRAWFCSSTKASASTCSIPRGQ